MIKVLLVIALALLLSGFFSLWNGEIFSNHKSKVRWQSYGAVALIAGLMFFVVSIVVFVEFG